ncbi:MAG: DUF2283 domain-containing protein [Candidatus Heimdallarchaeota archaeon]
MARTLMKIDPLRTVHRVLEKNALSLPHVVSLDYDEEADVLYIYFKINPEIAESDMIDKQGPVYIERNAKGEPEGLVIVNAYKLWQE